MRSALLAACAVLGLAGQAGAVDLTGTWQFAKHGTCRGMTAAGQKVLLKPRDTTLAGLPISQSGSDLRVYMDGLLLIFGGLVYAEPSGDEGQGILQKCNGDPDIRITYRIQKAETFPANSKGVSGKMTALYVFGNSTQTYECKATWERVSTADPGAADCP